MNLYAPPPDLFRLVCPFPRVFAAPGPPAIWLHYDGSSFMLSWLGIFKRFRIPSWLMPAIGYLISLACLIWLARTIDLETMREDLRSLHWGWVAVAVVSDMAVYVFQAWRWALLLRPVASSPLWRTVQSIYVGLFANEVLPLRPGEIIRCYLQARWSEIPFSVVFSSIVIERVFDGFWLAAAFFVTARQVGHLPNFLMELATALAATVGVLSLLIGLVMFRKHRAHAVVRKARWAPKLRVLVDDLHAMGASRSFYLALLASLGYLLLQAVPIYALMQAFQWELSVGAAMVVLVVLRLGTVVPQAPGNIGSSQALMVLALGFFEVERGSAISYSVMTWSVITLPLLVAGFVAVAITDLNLGELRRHAKSHLSRPAEPAASPRTR